MTANEQPRLSVCQSAPHHLLGLKVVEPLRQLLAVLPRLLPRLPVEPEVGQLLHTPEEGAPAERVSPKRDPAVQDK